MGERTAYAPGTFCWADLSTTDPEAARAFYGRMLGWEGEAGDPEFGGYYVSVEDADAAVARAEELGGAVLLPPFDVAPVGRMALIADPQGAAVAVWQAGEMSGASVVNQTGAMCLNQLNTSDPEAAQAFYGALFGWEFSQVADGALPYWGITNGGALNGGLMALDPAAPAPPHWLVYFTADDLDGADALIVDGGGVVVVPPMPTQSGRFLVAHDPQYAFFALFEGDVDP